MDIGEPQLSRRKRPPKHLDGGHLPYFPETIEEYYKVKHLEALDLLVSGIKTRFDQPGDGVTLGHIAQAGSSSGVTSVEEENVDKEEEIAVGEDSKEKKRMQRKLSRKRDRGKKE
ncbi:hypothetical protein ACROYT_G013891 [Oculina patagonica]